jgi:hypothetical protein
MRIKISNATCYVIVAASLLWLCSLAVAIGQSTSQQKAGIVSISASSEVTVQIEVRAADKELVIPYCKEAGTEYNLLYCNQGLEHNMEYFDGKKWIRTMPGYHGEVFGVDLGAWKPAVIAPNGSTTFKYKFSPDFFHLREGEKLRLVIFTWASAESLANNEKPVSKFVSPVFVCP